MKALLRSRIRFLRYLLALVFLLPEVVQATHLRAGNILMTLIDCETRRYRIRVEVYTNTTNTNVLFGGEQDYLDFGDRTGRILVPEIGPGDPRYSTDGLPAGTARAYFEIDHTFAGPGTYTVSYVEPNRNAGVVNMDQSVNTTFYLETQVVIDPFYGCSSPAILEVPPIDRACTTVAWFHNPGAKDLDGDRLSYQMVIPFRDRATTVLNYREPNDGKFYTNFNNGQEPNGNDPTGPPQFNIHPADGTVTWNAPGTAGEYNIAFIVIDWRLIKGQWRQMGYVRRDMQILVEECDNKRPELIIPEDICVTAGATIEETIKGTDPDGDRIRITAFSETFDFPAQQSPATLTPASAFQPSPGQVAFRWVTDCEHVRQQPYTVNFKVEDEKGLVNYKTWRITVVGPAPVWVDAQLNTAIRTATLTWERYQCQNAEFIQVWRKVDSTSFRPDTCQTGMPPGLGYELIKDDVPARIPPSQATWQFVDNNGGKGLAPGAMYCYRLVAVFPLPQGGESYVTEDICVGPIPADVPIITNVSIERTSVQDGLIRISWKRPFDLDPVVYPPGDLKYEVYRADGFERIREGNNASDSTLVASLLDGDTTYLDGGMNTEASVYNYSVVAYNGHATGSPIIGASEVASSVRLGSSSQKDQITLDWTAEVPWSNQIEAHPYHYIYRGDEDDAEDQLVLIDSVQVTASGFQYVDAGLETGTTYCYRILTNGGYGNPTKIPEPLENFSQRICVQPGDSIPPCKPILTIARTNCDSLQASNLCRPSVGGFLNTVYLSSSNAGECQTDVVRYYVYRGDYKGNYVRIDTLDATAIKFEDKGLSSLAYCYRISAVDFSGNESEMSDAVCNDNCPAYGLPNVFSPNGDEFNPVFKAFSYEDCEGGEGGGEGGLTCPDYVLEQCARFVKSVRFNVYNRWGREVYTYTASVSNDESILINWDGKDKNGRMLDPAVYYYVAEVTFDVLNPNDAVKTFKGWVHLLNDRQ
ncbi:T9SS type B sorting domain-containing protein [Dawidia soli]|uniref:Gliding motility-associated C-terminal domain-containing protein n=1 Tax=Dawidia soli TaxID=2782352 RepID=A0AAP2GE21_9BACT|nr:gliding motility-associated C-terminal domain-containing protein [Dawidia soli]MBT1687919.1 gliding motility-associated C-terminal domain-containing protein [Dawidia soli]